MTRIIFVELRSRKFQSTLILERFVDATTGGTFLSQEVWEKLGKPDLQSFSLQFQSTSKHLLPVLGTFVKQTTLAVKGNTLLILYNVTNINNLNVLGRDAVASLNISDKILFCSSSTSMELKFFMITGKQSLQLQEACIELLNYAITMVKFSKSELRCLNNFELEVHFNLESKAHILQTKIGTLCYTILFDAGL